MRVSSVAPNGPPSDAAPSSGIVRDKLIIMNFVSQVKSKRASSCVIPTVVVTDRLALASACGAGLRSITSRQDMESFGTMSIDALATGADVGADELFGFAEQFELAAQGMVMVASLADQDVDLMHRC